MSHTIVSPSTDARRTTKHAPSGVDDDVSVPLARINVVPLTSSVMLRPVNAETCDGKIGQVVDALQHLALHVTARKCTQLHKWDQLFVSTVSFVIEEAGTLSSTSRSIIQPVATPSTPTHNVPNTKAAGNRSPSSR